MRVIALQRYLLGGIVACYLNLPPSHNNGSNKQPGLEGFSRSNHLEHQNGSYIQHIQHTKNSVVNTKEEKREEGEGSKLHDSPPPQKKKCTRP